MDERGVQGITSLLSEEGADKDRQSLVNEAVSMLPLFLSYPDEK